MRWADYHAAQRALDERGRKHAHEGAVLKMEQAALDEQVRREVYVSTSVRVILCGPSAVVRCTRGMQGDHLPGLGELSGTELARLAQIRLAHERWMRGEGDLALVAELGAVFADADACKRM